MADNNSVEKFISSVKFPLIFKAFSMSIIPSKLLIAFLAVAGLAMTGYVMDYSQSVTAVQNSEGEVVTELDVYISGNEDVSSFIDEHSDSDKRSGVFVTTRDFLADRFDKTVYALFDRKISQVLSYIGQSGKAVAWAFRFHLFYSVVYSLVGLAIISVAGGAICRLAALELSRGEKPGPMQALRYSAGRFPAFFSAPLLPLALGFVPGMFVLIVGLLGNIPGIGPLMLGILMLPAFFLSFATALVVIAILGGSAMILPVVSYEGTGPFDVMSRVFSYTFSRPWHLGFYYIVTAVYGAICYFFVRFFAFIVLAATYVFMRIAVFTGPEPGSDRLAELWPMPEFLELTGRGWPVGLTGMEAVSVWLIRAAVAVVIGLIAAFLISFTFSSSTIIYALMRKEVDDIEPGRVHLPLKLDSEC